jgi:hypothetical protein
VVKSTMSSYKSQKMERQQERAGLDTCQIAGEAARQLGAGEAEVVTRVRCSVLVRYPNGCALSLSVELVTSGGEYW